ncbi:MAG: ATP-binding cassette domain-containing protein [Methanobacteriaceae archaeon]|jgi:ABC-2 type transport system ATP-binding protein|nr:ATP-binding cassette domain-containing protein [Methanobacteriaceae archaeon]
MKYIIETEKLTKKYGDFTAVNSLTMKIPKNSIFGMLGPNGAGKTTTIKMLTCLAYPSSGTATVSRFDIQKNPNEVRETLGMVPQHVSLYKDLTVLENAELCADFYGVKEEDKLDRINELMDLVDITYAKDKRIGQLSGGQKQKASLVASLVHRPEILFLDEPTIGLDPTTKRILWELMEDLNSSGHTIILCSHDMHEVDRLCDNVAIINTGNLVAYDSPRGLKDILLNEEKQNYSNIKETLSNIQNNNEKLEFNYRRLSFLIENISDELINNLKSIDFVFDVNISKQGRVELQVDKFEDKAINNITSSIIKDGGIISSFSSEEPSLEDVFIKVTSEAEDDARA